MKKKGIDTIVSPKNVMAKALAMKTFQNKIIKSKKVYDRKKVVTHKEQYEWLNLIAV